MGKKDKIEIEKEIFWKKLNYVTAMFIRLGKRYWKTLMMIMYFDDSFICSNLIHFMSRFHLLVFKFLCKIQDI